MADQTTEQTETKSGSGIIGGAIAAGAGFGVLLLCGKKSDWLKSTSKLSSQAICTDLPLHVGCRLQA